MVPALTSNHQLPRPVRCSLFYRLKNFGRNIEQQRDRLISCGYGVDEHHSSIASKTLAKSQPFGFHPRSSITTPDVKDTSY